MLVEGLVSLLTADSGVQTALGYPRSTGDNGIYPNVAPDEVKLPYIVYTQISRDAIPVFGGINRFQETRLQFSCYGSTYKIAKKTAVAVKNVLDGFTGKLTDPDDIVVGNVLPVAEHDEPETVFKGTVYGVHLDYAVMSTG